MEAVIVSYYEAKCLAENCKDIIVFEPSSGSAWNYNNPNWEYQGISYSFDNILHKIGYDGLSSHYLYIWVKNR